VPDNEPETLNFVFFMSILVLINTLLSVPFLTLYEDEQENFDVKRRVVYMCFVTGGTITMITVSAFLQDYFSFTTRIIFGIILTCFYFSPFGLASGCLNTLEAKPVPLYDDFNEKSNIASDAGLIQMLSGLNAWLLFTSSAFIIGAGFMVLTNINQMLESLHFTSHLQICISLFSVSQSVSRISIGFISDYFNLPRPFFVFCTCIVMTLSHFIFYMFDTNLTALFISNCLAGIGYGAVWPLNVMIVKELWGTKYHSRNYMFYDGCCTAFGALSLSKFLPSAIYNQNNHTGTNTCYGRNCFAWTHLIICFIGAFACMTSLFMTKRTWTHYLGGHAKSSTLQQDDIF